MNKELFKAKIILILGFLLFSSSAWAASFIVTDSDFEAGVYDFQYLNFGGSKTLINGVDQSIADPTLTNTAWICCTTDNSIVTYWRGNGAAAGALTMGWDFSGVSGKIAKIELRTQQFIFQFPPFGDDAAGDQIYGNVATPISFGAGTYTELYRITSDNPTNDPNAPGAIGAGSLMDITTSIDGGWLASPDLLELQLGYDRTSSSTIPERHLQVFRDGGAGENFILRVTLESAVIPIPAAVWLFGSSLLCLIGSIRRINK